MEFIFLLDVGPKHGLGHLNRCLALAEEALYHNTRVSMFLSGSEPSTAKDWTRQLSGNDVAQRITYRSLDSVDFAGRFYTHQPDSKFVFILDSYVLDVGGLVTKLRSFGYVCVIADSACQFHCNLLIYPNLHSPNVQVQEGTNILSGKRFLLLRRSVLAQWGYRVRESLSSPLEKIKVGLSLGGSTDIGMYVKILKVLSRLNYKTSIQCLCFIQNDLQKLAIESLLRELDDYRLPVEYFVSSESYQFTITSQDIVIGAGGTSLLERVALGIPSVVLSVAKNQDENLSLAEKNKIAVMANLISLESVLSEILIDRSRIVVNLHKLSLHAKQFLQNTDGARYIYDWIQRDIE